jgi:hypothetical protein
MTKNVIVLTHGWSGSSMLAALLGTARYWLGEETVEKSDYDTFENRRLVELNRQMMSELGLTENYEHEFSFESILELERRADRLDWNPYRDFVATCEEKAPWAWKDPRLTWTIRLWHRLLPVDRTAFIVLTRDDRQAWVSSNLRRHVQSMAFTQAYNHGITRANVAFLEQHKLPYIKLSYEDLLLSPGPTLERLNEFLGLGISMGDLLAVSRGKLYQKSRSFSDYVVATLIYWKNYGERDGRWRRGKRSEGALAPP